MLVGSALTMAAYAWQSGTGRGRGVGQRGYRAWEASRHQGQTLPAACLALNRPQQMFEGTSCAPYCPGMGRPASGPNPPQLPSRYRLLRSSSVSPARCPNWVPSRGEPRPSRGSAAVMLDIAAAEIWNRMWRRADCCCNGRRGGPARPAGGVAAAALAASVTQAGSKEARGQAG